MKARIDYDAIADGYDAQPYRGKELDPWLADFAGASSLELGALDLACGTGNQILANRAHFPELRFVGVDASEGMLRVARSKAPDLEWVQAPADDLPFGDGTFDYASCQFAYHHFPEVPAALREAHRVLRPGGRFVVTNVSPHDCPQSAFYRAFAGAWERDSRDFQPLHVLSEMLTRAGFASVATSTRRVSETESLGELLEYVSVRTNNSHLTALSDDAYAAGLAWLRARIAERGASAPAENPVVIATLVAER